MAETTTNLVLHLRKILAGQAILGAPDAELAERFHACQDDAAFAALIERHGGMVLGVCRRVLADGHDAEDAWQATFLVLARRIGTIRKLDSLASWLHGVAFRIASDVRRRRERAHAKPLDADPLAPAHDPTWSEVRAALDEELAGLPERWRNPIILCHLEGKTRDEAAEALGCTVGAVRGCLERGRALLAARLKKRGIALSAALVATLLVNHPTAASVPATLAVATTRLAGPVALGGAMASAIPDSQILLLVQGAIRAMFYAKLKWSAAIAACVAFFALCGASALWLCSAGASAAPPEPLAAVAPDRPDVQKRKPQPKLPDGMKPATKKAIDDGLAFLAAEQGADGSWTFRGQNNVGVTSLAGAAFVSAGHAPGKGRYQATVRAAIAFLQKNIDPNLPGYFNGPNNTHGPMYGHGFATLFLAEAYRASPDMKAKKEMKSMIEGAVQVIVQAQNAAGGWRYKPQPADADLTVTACQLRALLAVRRAGVAVPQKTLEAGFAFMAKCQRADGSFAYQPHAGNGSYTRSAVALSALAEAGRTKDAAAQAGIAYAKQVAGPGVAKLRADDMYYWYARMHENRALASLGNANARYDAMQTEILDRRQQGRWTDRTLGASYGTAMAILSLSRPSRD